MKYWREKGMCNEEGEKEMKISVDLGERKKKEISI